MFTSISFNLHFGNFFCNSFSFNSDSSTYTFDINSEADTSNVFCPLCGAKVHIYDNSTVHLRGKELICGTVHHLNVNVHRYRCTSCNHSFTEDIPFKYPGTRITKNLACYIRQLLDQNMSIKSISDITGVHWETISRIHTECMNVKIKEREKELSSHNYHPKYLAVDEFAIHKGHTYATCVMDLENGDIIWIGKGRAIRDFLKFFNDVPADYLSEVKAVSMDMNASYNTLVEQYLPHAQIVYDRYHFQSQYGRDVLGSVRLEEARVHREKAVSIRNTLNDELSLEKRIELKKKAKDETILYSKLKKSRWSLLRNGAKSADNEQLRDILETHSKLAVCYAMKEEIIRLYELKDITEAEEGWCNWFRAAKQSGISQLVKFAEQKEKRLTGLISHAVHHISTGKLEGFNNKIKVAKRIGYGYRNDEHFFTMIKYLSLPSVRFHTPRNP